MSTVCRFPDGTVISIWQDDDQFHDPHFHATKGTGPTRRKARVFWRDDPVSYEESPKSRLRLKPKELKKTIQWAANHRSELDAAYEDVQVGRVPKTIPFP